jgi:hypothetical protein
VSPVVAVRCQAVVNGERAGLCANDCERMASTIGVDDRCRRSVSTIGVDGVLVRGAFHLSLFVLLTVRPSSLMSKAMLQVAHLPSKAASSLQIGQIASHQRVSGYAVGWCELFMLTTGSRKMGCSRRDG